MCFRILSVTSMQLHKRFRSAECSAEEISLFLVQDKNAHVDLRIPRKPRPACIITWEEIPSLAASYNLVATQHCHFQTYNTVFTDLCSN